MKKGVNFWCFDAGTTPIEAVNLASRHGFDGIELALEEEDLAGDLTRFDEAQALAQSLGIEIFSVATTLYWTYPLTSQNPEVSDRARTILRRQLQVARHLGCSSILVVPGLVTPEDPYDAVYSRALAEFMEAAEWAEQAGVTIAIENVWNRFLLSPLEFRGFLDTVNSPFVRAYFDVGNVMLYGYPEQWIRILESRIANIHVKDFQRQVGTMAGFTHLLQGDVEWSAVLSALTDVGYQGYVTTEIPPYPNLAGNQSIQQLSASLDIILKRESPE